MCVFERLVSRPDEAIGPGALAAYGECLYTLGGEDQLFPVLKWNHFHLGNVQVLLLFSVSLFTLLLYCCLEKIFFFQFDLNALINNILQFKVFLKSL